MNKYIKSYTPINESVQQHGIILIKGKPNGKSGDQMLYATHVNSSIEVRPSATMLLLSDTFYRIIKGDSGKLKGVKINWRDEDSLKSVLNFKSPGKLSVVKNNNKTPYHWKTLKHTNLSAALSAVDGDINTSSYIFESVEQASPKLTTQILSDTLNSIFLEKDNSVILLNYHVPKNVLEDDLSGDEDRGHHETQWEFSLDCLYIGKPELDQELKSTGMRRFTVEFQVTTGFQYASWYDPGDRDTPGDGGTELSDFSTTIDMIYLDGEETNFEPSEKFITNISDCSDDDVDSWIKKNNVTFI